MFIPIKVLLPILISSIIGTCSNFCSTVCLCYLGIANADGVVNKDKDYVPKLLKMHNFILTSADWNSFISKIEVLEDGLTEVDYDKCIKCGICVEACPSCILSMGDLDLNAILIEVV